MSPLPSRDRIDAIRMHDSSDISASDKTLAALRGPGSVILRRVNWWKLVPKRFTLRML